MKMMFRNKEKMLGKKLVHLELDIQRITLRNHSLEKIQWKICSQEGSDKNYRIDGNIHDKCLVTRRKKRLDVDIFKEAC